MRVGLVGSEMCIRDSSVCLSVCLSVSVSLPAFVPACLSLSLSVCVSVSLSLSISVCLCHFLSLSLPVSKLTLLASLHRSQMAQSYLVKKLHFTVAIEKLFNTNSSPFLVNLFQNKIRHIRIFSHLLGPQIGMSSCL